MTAPRKVTVQVSVWFEDMAMEDTDAAMDIIKSVLATASHECQDEIKRALAAVGARDISISMLAY